MTKKIPDELKREYKESLKKAEDDYHKATGPIIERNREELIKFADPIFERQKKELEPLLKQLDEKRALIKRNYRKEKRKLGIKCKR